MASSIYQLIYLSTANPELDEETLSGILSSSQKRNAQRGITGLLLHSDGNIIQIIEGDEAAVETLFAKINNDPRHRGLMVLSRKTVKQRDFPEYKMGFRRVSPALVSQEIPGFSDIIEQRKLPTEALEKVSTLVSVLLKTFSQTTRLEG